MKVLSVMVSTSDNPYDPFEQFEQWDAFDRQKGYNTCSYLARVAYTSHEFTVDENEEAIERAIDEIVKFNFTGNRVKVYSKDDPRFNKT